MMWKKVRAIVTYREEGERERGERDTAVKAMKLTVRRRTERKLVRHIAPSIAISVENV